MPSSDYAPTVAEVAKLVRARTRDAVGNLIGTFNDETTPNAADAQGLIDEALDEVGGEIDADIPEDYWPAAKRVVELLAAANIEMSYFPEQAAATNSMYDKLMARYKDQLPKLIDNITEEEEDQGTTNDPVVDPAGSFPAPLGWGQVNW